MSAHATAPIMQVAWSWRGREENIVSEQQLEEMGPIDHVVLEWPGELSTTGEVQPLLLDLVNRASSGSSTSRS